MDDASESKRDDDDPSDTDEDESEGTTDVSREAGDDDEEQVTCEAFETQEEAQEYLDENPEERDRLDEDNNGVPCESLSPTMKAKAVILATREMLATTATKEPMKTSIRCRGGVPRIT